MNRNDDADKTILCNAKIPTACWRFDTIECIGRHKKMRQLKEFVTEYSVRNRDVAFRRVFSVTNSSGFMPSTDYFNKEVFSKDLSTYKIVKPGMLAYNPSRINVGSVDCLHLDSPVIVSPLYVVIQVDDSHLLPEYLNIFLHSDIALRQIKALTSGSVRDSLKFPAFSKLQIPIPSIENQKEIIAHLERIRMVILHRELQCNKLDQLAKSRFIEMFGDPIANPKGWSIGELDPHVDVLTGYPFDSSKYTENGIKICGGLIIMPGRIDWADCKYWAAVDGFEEYLLQDGDIVLALDRPWISDGFKIACIGEDELPCLLIQRTARIRGRDMNQRFLYAILNSDAFQAHCTVTGSLVPHISHKDIKNFKTIIPPLALQNEFAAFIEQLDKSKLAKVEVAA